MKTIKESKQILIKVKTKIESKNQISKIERTIIKMTFRSKNCLQMFIAKI